MTNHPNYRAINPAPDKSKEDYTYAERRAELYNMLDRAGHYRNLEQSTRSLGDRFGVSHTTIRNDIQAILEWKADHLGDNIEGELETLKTKAVQDALENDNAEKAYEIMSTHLENLQSIGVIDKEPEQLEHSGTLFNLPESVTDEWEHGGDE